MLTIDGIDRHSSQDLLAFVRCDRLTGLRRRGIHPPNSDAAAAEGERTMDDVVLELGEQHEEAIKQRYAAEVGEVVTVDVGDRSPTAVLAAAEETRRLLAAGVAVVHQGVLLGERWMGYADFLVRVESPSSLGDHSYEVADAKLGRELKAAALVQTSLYAVLLEQLQGSMPEWLHLDLGGGQPRVTRAMARSVAYTRRLMARYLADLGSGSEVVPDPAPVPWCASCEFLAECDAWWQERDDLVAVAGLRSAQRARLREAGITTVAELASRHPVDDEVRVPGIGARTLADLAAQAALQVATREQLPAGTDEPQPVVERLAPTYDDDGGVQQRGLLGLPAPSPGDVFYDIEGNPLLEPHGLEYLHGVWLGEDTETGVAAFQEGGGERNDRFLWAWADDDAEERRALELVVDLFVARVDAHPGAFIYHYAPYETAALFRLAQRHATREAELDRLLRDGRFIDLYAVVRQGLRVGAESYSIKTLERLYLTDGRHGEVAKADDSVVQHHRYQEASPEVAAGIRADIVEYNEEDCRSTAELRGWLEGHRAELVTDHGLAVNLRPVVSTEPVAAEDDPSVRKELALVAACLERAELAEPSEREAWETLAGLAGWHRRERKASWAGWFRSIEVADVAEAEASSQVLGGLRRDAVSPLPGPGTVRYRVADQDHRIDSGDQLFDLSGWGSPGAEPPPELGKVMDITTDPASGDLLLDLVVRGADAPAEVVAAAAKPDSFPDASLIASLHRTIDDALGGGLDRSGAAMDLLQRRVPTSLLRTSGDDPNERAIEVARLGGPGVLAIQGPPGTGKTELAARLLLALVRDGQRVGITALSHNAISEVVERVTQLATPDRPVRIGQAPKSGETAAERRRKAAELSSNGATLTLEPSATIAATVDDLDIVAGTVWLWSRPELAGKVDVLLIDEASQLSLANAMAGAAAAQRLILVGDPQQLTQPTQASHPGDAANSALDHLLGSAADGPAVIAPEQGVFLDSSFRMHPDICAVVSRLSYDGRLEAVDGCRHLDLRDAGPLGGTGVRFVPVTHSGNASSSPEEAEVVRDLVEQLTGATFVDHERRERTITHEDIAVITPYNAQVARLDRALPPGVGRGTVDRYQGKTAAVVIISLAASSADDAPRGLDFLLDRNRLNVALSRARAAVFVVGSPELMDASPSTIRAIEAANDLSVIASDTE
ncbi:MAG: TM0106 family RecB-like putative nuclease [Nitriliruptoraceae bacterium]